MLTKVFLSHTNKCKGVPLRGASTYQGEPIQNDRLEEIYQPLLLTWSNQRVTRKTKDTRTNSCCTLAWSITNNHMLLNPIINSTKPITICQTQLKLHVFKTLANRWLQIRINNSSMAKAVLYHRIWRPIWTNQQLEAMTLLGSNRTSPLVKTEAIFTISSIRCITRKTTANLKWMEAAWWSTQAQAFPTNSK